MEKNILIGPFRQVVTMEQIPLKGPLQDNQLPVIESAGIMIQGEKIIALDSFNELKRYADENKYEILQLTGDFVAMPGMTDPHTHICYAGSRSNDYALRLAGVSYLEIAARGGGIWSTVTSTRKASDETLFNHTKARALSLLNDGVTTVEVKSGYALNVKDELRMLEIINEINNISDIDIVPTCLAAHTLPKDFQGSAKQYLEFLIKNLLPEVRKRNLSSRADIYIEKSAFSADEGLYYLEKAINLGFDAVVHADQFSIGGSDVAVRAGAVSADHLEVSSDEEISRLARTNAVAICLPGASIGLGTGFAPARKMLDAGCSVAVASDWNPGSAPMGDVLIQACILGAYEHLTMAETLAAVTCRASAALKLQDRGILKKDCLADVIAFPVSDFRDIVYYQGKMKPTLIVKKGKIIRKP
ncbi:MAG: imidazolonepropionase [Bacteroidales bacterium]|nr:imidazolonepropionase [Bacteroidales bacterium]